METIFQQLNVGWNAEPNSPDVKVEWCGPNLLLSFQMNSFQFADFAEGDIGEIVFTDCARFRLGTLNDEAWFKGKSRFTSCRHKWGEFYEIRGDLKLDALISDWESRISVLDGLNHYLFYFRDEDFECDAAGWDFRILQA